jgi:predicted dehydrogenase
MKTYKAAVVGCSRMGGFIDHEVMGRESMVLPYSHAAGFYACDRTDLVACSDLREDVMERFGLLYDVPKERQYTDYKELIAKEQPDVVSVATQPEHRAEVVIHAVENGVRAIYAEKAMAASMREAADMVEAVERNGAFFNLGTNRRWSTAYDAMKGVIDSGRLGALRSIIIYQNTSLFNGSSHNFDIAQRLNSDHPVVWAQGHLPEDYRGAPPNSGDFQLFDGDRMLEDPSGHGIFQFENDVTVYALLSGRSRGFEAVCERGVMTVDESRDQWLLEERSEDGVMAPGAFPEFEPASATLRLIEDLVHSLDTGEPERGGVRVAYANNELLFAFIESHVRGGARVELPLQGSKFYLLRDRAPRQPLYEPRSS